jgi:hypothetical protein
MYFQTGQVIFVPEWPKGEFVSILASFCVWTKSLMCKRCCKQGFHLSEYFQKTLHCEKDRRFQIPCQPSGRSVIPSGRPSVHCSFRPDDMFIPTRHQTDQHHPSGRRIFSVRNLHYVEKLLFQLASVRTSQQPVRTSISDRSASDSFQVQNMGRLTHRPDALINKARIVIQISSFGRQSVLVQTRMQLIWKLPLLVRTHA